MSLGPTLVRAADGLYYQDPVFEGTDAAGRRWFVCFDEDDPPELIVEVLKADQAKRRQDQDRLQRTAAATILKATFPFAVSIAPARWASRCFGSVGKMAPASAFDLTFKALIPIPHRFEKEPRDLKDFFGAGSGTFIDYSES